MLCLFKNIVKLIISTHVGFFGSGRDQCIWKLTSNGTFSIKFAYGTSNCGEDFLQWHWHFIWKRALPPKLKIFLWVPCYKKLLTNAERLRGGLAQNMICHIYNSLVESIKHLFRDCSVTLSIWEGFGFSPENDAYSAMGFDDWLFHNLQSRRIVVHGLPWF